MRLKPTAHAVRSALRMGAAVFGAMAVGAAYAQIPARAQSQAEAQARAQAEAQAQAEARARAQAEAQALDAATAQGPLQPNTDPNQPPAAVPLDQPPPQVSLITGVRSALTFSDNLTLAPPGAERAGFVTEVSPYALYNANTDRLRGTGYVTLRNFIRSDGDNVSLARVNLNGNFTARMYDDWLWLDGLGQIGNIAASPFGPTFFDPAVYNINTATYRLYSLSPHIRSRTPYFDYELRYRYTHSNISSSVLGNTLHSGSANANTGTRLGRWSLGYFGEVTRVTLGNGRTIDRQLSTGTLGLAVNPELRVGVMATYEKIDTLRGTNGRNYGVGPGAFFDWRPNSRTSLYGQVSRRYYGNTSLVSANWRTRGTTWNALYTRSVLSSADASLLFFDPAALGGTNPNAPNFNPVASRLFQQNLLLFGLRPLDLSLISNALVLDKRLVATGGLVGQFNSLLATVFYNTRESVGEFSQTAALGTGTRGGTTGGLGTTFTGRLLQSGFTLDYLHRLDAASTVNLTARRTSTEVEGFIAGVGAPGETTLTQFLVGWNTRLTVDTTAGFAYRRSVQRRNGLLGSSYTENALIGTLDLRF